ncbi:WD40 repeat-like protein [Dacryopinax primogenitus]|uniref:WD40 repeat-like protein n=1 Tax=Dacryopinax primogenitus (strain DJM 731) TaxID=1858805 RepID=M5G0P1_DACPD|nr:WD40 repeat-like protein [Dacryopinax primogenitus]EJU02314.1 WD40 repeat-like protein [Dacryopinax primogenitus]
MSSSVEIELDNAPVDMVSSLHFSPATADHLLVSAWDGSVRLYDVTKDDQLVSVQHRAPVLDIAYPEAARAYSASLDGSVRIVDIEKGTVHTLGTHGNAARSVVWSESYNFLLSGSWDATVRAWDVRSPTPQILAAPHPERVYSMDADKERLVVCMAGRHVRVWDLRMLRERTGHKEPAQVRESSLKFQVRKVACMPEGEGFASSSVEGRIAIDYYDHSENAQAKKYAFKCHRTTVDGVENIFPVNALAFHPTYATLLSGGSDASISIWDIGTRKRIKQLPKFRSAVQAIAVSRGGERIAVGCGDGLEEGDKPVNASVFVRMSGDEAKPKPKTSA